ncbi:MAG TPA: protealysin inhibitor emfourin [Steroidobacteraceae bacterium]
MGILKVEKLGGFAGYGNPGSRIRSQGEIAVESLSEADRQSVTRLFKSRQNSPPSVIRDGYRYRLSHATAIGTEMVEVAEDAVPQSIRACAKDELL